MEQGSEKCVIVVDGALPIGFAANTAAILGVTLGKERPEVVGPNVFDREGGRHLGIIRFPIPILKGVPEQLRTLREKLSQPEYEELAVVEFSDLAQGCKTYDEFVAKMGRTEERELRYLGVAICGARKKVERLTGNLPLLR